MSHSLATFDRHTVHAPAMNCPSCGAPDFDEVCQTCGILTLPALIEIRNAVVELSGTPGASLRDLAALLERRGLLTPREIAAAMVMIASQGHSTPAHAF